MAGKVLYVVRVKIAARDESSWNQWHNEKHIPMVLEQPGFLQVRKFRCLSNNPKEAEYFVIYELRNKEAYHRYVKSEEGRRIRQHYLDAYAAKTNIVRWACEETFSLVKK